MIDAGVRTEILDRLHHTEQEHQVRILYACESGSRAWGFASPDSDYDVRFVYARPRDWYLSFDVERRRDVIEYPIVDEIDLNGWDIRKALALFTRTNGALLEWLHSPIVYLEQGDFAASLRALAPTMLNHTALCYHYSHMARGNAREYLNQARVRLKKYFYVLRPLLAIRYIEGQAAIPPVAFEELLNQVAPEQILPETLELLALKRQSPEMGKGTPRATINAFINAELIRHGTSFSGLGRPDLHQKQEVYRALNTLFRESISAFADASS